MIRTIAIAVLLSMGWAGASMADELTASFTSPPNESKPWCYWWWLNGAASKEGITRDFE